MLKLLIPWPSSHVLFEMLLYSSQRNMIPALIKIILLFLGYSYQYVFIHFENFFFISNYPKLENFLPGFGNCNMGIKKTLGYFFIGIFQYFNISILGHYNIWIIIFWYFDILMWNCNVILQCDIVMCYSNIG